MSYKNVTNTNIGISALQIPVESGEKTFGRCELQIEVPNDMIYPGRGTVMSHGDVWGEYIQQFFSNEGPKNYNLFYITVKLLNGNNTTYDIPINFELFQSFYIPGEIYVKIPITLPRECKVRIKYGANVWNSPSVFKSGIRKSNFFNISLHETNSDRMIVNGSGNVHNDKILSSVTYVNDKNAFGYEKISENLEALRNEQFIGDNQQPAGFNPVSYPYIGAIYADTYKWKGLGDGHLSMGPAGCPSSLNGIESENTWAQGIGQNSLGCNYRLRMYICNSNLDDDVIFKFNNMPGQPNIHASWETIRKGHVDWINWGYIPVVPKKFSNVDKVVKSNIHYNEGTFSSSHEELHGTIMNELYGSFGNAETIMGWDGTSLDTVNEDILV